MLTHRTLRLAALSGLVAGLLAGAPPAQAAPARFGQLLVPATSWSGGVNVRSDSLRGCPRRVVDHGHAYCDLPSATRSPSGRLVRTGVKYDAVELALRVMVTRGWISKALPAVSRPSQLYSAAPASLLDHHLVTRGYTPVPGDLIVWDGAQPGTGGRGQVAVVDRVSAGTVRFVQQGAASPVGTLVLGYADVRHVIGYLHARVNTASIPGTQTPPPNAVGDESMTSFVDPGGALQLFVLTTSGVVHHEQLPGHAWTSELAATGRFRRVAALAAGGSLELFAIAADGVERLTRTAGGWLPAQLVTAGRFTEIAALAEAGGAEDVFTLSASGLRHDRLLPGSTWVGEPVAGGVYTQISAVQDPATRLLHLFAIDGFGIDHFADLPGTPWGREVLTGGDFTQVATQLTARGPLVAALDADGVNGYQPSLRTSGLEYGGVDVDHGRYRQIALVVDKTGAARVLALLAHGFLDSGSTTGSYGLPSVTGSFSQLSAVTDPVTGALQVFLVSHGGIVQATSPDGVTWTTSAIG